MTEYDYTKSPLDVNRLTKEIRDSSITISLDHINALGADVKIFFKTDISTAERTALDAIVAAHTGEPLLIQDKPQEVITALEKNDKVLRAFCAWADTDSNGAAEICIPIPTDGRWVAYGDAEFSIRHMGDYVSVIEITDLDRLIAMQIALSIDPNATAPVADSVVQANGYPLYPVLGHYDERAFPTTMPANAKGTIRGGMGMTFQYGITEQVPVGGYAFVPGNFYFRVVGQKATGHTTGFTLQISVDWAQNG